MIPFTPHLAHECLQLLKCKDDDSWPKIKPNLIDEIKFAIQVNGKTRDIITVLKNMDENKINKIVLEKSKARKFIQKKNIFKTIFVKDKIINYILK